LGHGHWLVSDTDFPVSRSLLQWLSAHTRFPASRLPAPAETLLCLAAAAEGGVGETAETSGGTFGIQRRDPVKESALRAHALRRSRVHFKCDNSAKV